MKAAWWAVCVVAWLALWPAGVHARATDNGMARIERLQAGIAVTPEQIPRQSESAWTSTAEPNQLAGAQHGSGWWRLHAKHAGDARLLLVYHPYSARLIVLAPPEYRPQRKSIFDAERAGGHSRRALAFAWDDTSQPVYIGVEDARYPLQVAVRTREDFSIEDYGHVRVLWLSLGILIGVSLVTLLFWLQLRERVYLLFAATMALQLMYVLLAYGDAYALTMFGWLARFGVEGIWFIATASTIVTVFFLLDFAELWPRAPMLSRMLFAVGAVLPSLLLVALLASGLIGTHDRNWFPPMGNSLLLAANVLAIITLTVVWLRGGRHAGFVLIAWVPLVAVSTARALQLGSGRPLNPWLEYGLPLMQAFAAVVLVLGLAHRMRMFQRERDAAQQDAEHDALTRVFNRAGTMRRLDRAIGESRQRRLPLAVLFLDLDHFKRINDTHGHAVGDACLGAVTEVIRSEMQPEQSLGRIGGEEFLLLLPGAARRQARDLAERIREQVALRCAEVQGAPVALTLSIGVVECQPADNTASLLQRADEAMYQAKHEGRNRVVVLDRHDGVERRNAVTP